MDGSYIMWYSPDSFFDLNRLEGGRVHDLLSGLTYVWDILDHLEPFIKRVIKPNVAPLRGRGDLITRAAGFHEGRWFDEVSYELGDPARGGLKVYHQGRELPGAALVMPGAILCGDDIEIGAGALVESGALIKGPAIIGPRSEVRQAAYVRGAVMSSPGAVIGHATEAKNTLLLDGAKAGHFAYLGDSVLGRDVNLGAGTRLANLKMNSSPHVFVFEDQKFQVDRRKFGAIIGDESETGCNAVINPGAIIGRRARVLPNSSIAAGYRPGRGFLGR